MTIVINGYPYENAMWAAEKGKGTLYFQSALPLSVLEERFLLDTGTVIEQYNDDEELIGKWYMHNLKSIGYKMMDGGWSVEAEFEVSSISQDKTEELEDGIDESDTALIELAGEIAELEESFETFRESVDGRFDDVQDEFRSKDEIISNVTTQIGNLTSRLDALADRVARLENERQGG